MLILKIRLIQLARNLILLKISSIWPCKYILDIFLMICFVSSFLSSFNGCLFSSQSLSFLSFSSYPRSFFFPLPAPLFFPTRCCLSGSIPHFRFMSHSNSFIAHIQWCNNHFLACQLGLLSSSQSFIQWLSSLDFRGRRSQSLSFNGRNDGGSSGLDRFLLVLGFGFDFYRDNLSHFLFL